MALSEMAAHFAAEIKFRSWAAVLDSLEYDGDDPGDPECLRMNVMWVTGKVLARSDPNFDIFEYSQACGCRGRSRKFIESGITDYPARRKEPT